MLKILKTVFVTGIETYPGCRCANEPERLSASQKQAGPGLNNQSSSDGAEQLASSISAWEQDPDSGDLNGLTAANNLQLELLLQQEAERQMLEWAEQGYEKGKEAAEAECRTLKENAMNKLIEAEICLREARQRAREIIAASERALVEISVAAAEQLLRSQLEIAPEKVVRIVRETIKDLAGGEQIAIFVNPDDLAICLDLRGELAPDINGGACLEIYPDMHISRGSCRIESESCSVEYLLETERETLRSSLLEIARQKERKLLQAPEEEPAYGQH